MFDFFKTVGLENPPYGSSQQALSGLTDKEKGLEVKLGQKDLNLFDTVVYLAENAHVTSDALALGLSSRWLGDRVSFNPSAQQTCWSNLERPPFKGGLVTI